MAFESVPGVKVSDHVSGRTYIFSDFFSVFERGIDLPRIYDWSELVSIAETAREFVFVTVDATYRLAKKQIPDTLKFLRIRAIAEGAVAVHPHIRFTFTDRILPAKSFYKPTETPTNAFVANGVYAEREIAHSNVTLTNTRMNKIFRTLCILIIVSTFIFLCVVVGDFAENWWYFIPISVFTGIIAIMFVYLVCAIVSKYIYTHLLNVDPSLEQDITFILSDAGFAAVESVIFTGFDLIPWSEAAYFVETNYTYIIFKNKKAVFWLPKRLFAKEIQRDLSNFIASRLQQK